MYSILMSKYEMGFELVRDRLKKVLNRNSKIVIIPWSFAVELDTKNINEYFNDKRRKKILEPLFTLGILESNITIIDCYNDTYQFMKKVINESDAIILTGGNPKMFYNKVLETGLLNDIKKYTGIVIGSSAGAELQLKKYFITKKNNYYNKFAWYNGFGIIDNDFYFDVHSINRGRYLPSLKKKSQDINKNIYCLFDDGAIIYNRENKEIETFGRVIKYETE